MSRGEDASRAAWGAAFLIVPHLVLGTWLLVVPDHLAFRTSQIVTLLHVGLASLTVPLVAFWGFRHAWRMEAHRERKSTQATTIRWLLAATAFFAMTTGAIVTWGGDIIRTHAVHAGSGLAVGVLLAFHLRAGGRHRAAAGVVALLLIATGGAEMARRFLPPESLDAAVPAFAYVTKPVDLYEPAALCGECHVENYADWKRSTHARTMDNPLIRAGYARQKDALGFELADFGTIIQGGSVPHANEAFNACEMCHTPTSFYGDDRQDPLHATGTPSEGVTCSFCHTLRAVKLGEGRGQPVKQELLDPSRRSALVPLLPQYVSAPETVRRYLGQGSKNRLAHWVSSALIRWRPNVHRHDYHAPILHSSLACMPCHSVGALDLRPELPQKTYRSWETSRYNTNDVQTTVRCQDCHMARRVTGKPSQEPGRYVPWGPIHAENPSHLFLGGNRTVPEHLHDEGLADLEHQLNLQVGRVTLLGARRLGSELEVDVRVETRLVGHDLPSMGAQNRWLWVEVSAKDASGRQLGVSKRPKDGTDIGGESPVMFRCIDHPSPACDTALAADVPRFFTARLKLGPGAVPALVVAALHLSIDWEPIAKDSKSFPF